MFRLFLFAPFSNATKKRSSFTTLDQTELVLFCLFTTTTFCVKYTMPYPSPAALVFKAIFSVAVSIAVVVAVDAYGTPVLEDVFQTYLAETLVGPYLGQLVIVTRVIMAVQSLTLIQFLHGLVSRERYSVSGKHVVITGGSQGLGLCLARHCLTKGAKVTIVVSTDKMFVIYGLSCYMYLSN